MKFRLCFLTLALTLSAALPAQATSMRPMRVSAVITRMDINPDHLSPSLRLGTVAIDYYKREVTLHLNALSRMCPPGRYCAAVMPESTTITLPLTSYRTDRCGLVRITAERDARPRDGQFEQITIQDNTSNICPVPMAVNKADTEIRYRSVSAGMGGRVIKAESRFEAERLAPSQSRRR